MKLSGTVTITLEDYQALLDHHTRTAETEEKTKLAAKELQVFLTYICDKTDISNYLDEFNRQSKTSQIVITNDRAQIKFKDEKENNS